MPGTTEPKLSRLVWRTLAGYAVALAIGVVAWIPLWVVYGPLTTALAPPSVSHYAEFTFTERPGDDAALRGWLDEQPGISKPEVTRQDDTVRLSLWAYTIERPAPPWERLGYAGVRPGKSGYVQFKPVRYGLAFHLFAIGKCACLGFLIVGLRHLRRTSGRSDPFWAWLRPSRRRDLFVALAVGLALWGLTVAWAQTPRLFGEQAWGASSYFGVYSMLARWSGVVALIGATTLVPLGVFFFCGMVYRSFAAAGRARSGVAVAAMLFAIVDVNPGLLPAYLALGVALCVLYARTGSLLVPFVAYAAFNAGTVGLVLFARGWVAGFLSRPFG